jgi:S-methylmethionine-dependent homocysteine/selenocysteine methylase
MAAEYNGVSDGAGAALEARLAVGVPLLLDGATGTELEERGVDCGLPLWSAGGIVRAPEVVLQIHRDYVSAGAEALTANTFRTQRRVLARARETTPAAELTARAVALARRAAREAATARRVFVLGSAPPLEDCFRPDLVPSDAVLAREHGDHARNLREAGVDAILIETMNTIREAVAASAAAREADTPFMVSFVCGADGRLLSGEQLVSAILAVAPLAPLSIGVNCLPPSAVSACMPALRSSGSGLPFSVAANLGAPEPSGGRSEALEPSGFAAAALGWVEAGARAVGGCCGTAPAHIAALERRLGGIAGPAR